MMAKIGVDILGRHLGTAMACDEKTYQAFTVYAFQPAHGLLLPELCDLVIDHAHGWVIPIRGEGAGEVVIHPKGEPTGSTVIDLVDLLHSIPRT